MKIELKLHGDKAYDEIVVLNDFIKEQNLKGLITKVQEKEAAPGTMNIGDLLPVIELVLGSTVVAAGVKGLFDILKNYFDLRKQKFISAAELEKAKIDQNIIEFDMEKKDGEKIKLKFNSFNETERQTFFKSVDEAFKE